MFWNVMAGITRSKAFFFILLLLLAVVMVFFFQLGFTKGAGVSSFQQFVNFTSIIYSITQLPSIWNQVPGFLLHVSGWSRGNLARGTQNAQSQKQMLVRHPYLRQKLHSEPNRQFLGGKNQQAWSLSPEMRRKLVVRLFDGWMTMVSLPPSNVPPSEIRVSFLRGVRWGVSHPLQVLTLMMLGRKQVNGLEFSGASKTSPELSIFDSNISCKMYQISKEDQKSTFWQNGEMKRREEKRKRETAQERR